MTAIAIRQSTVSAMTPQQTRLARWALGTVGMVQPAAFIAPSGQTWYVFDDDRIDLRDVAYFGCFAAQLGSVPSNWTVPASLDDATAAASRASLRGWLSSRVAWPLDVSGSSNAYATVLSANSAPATLQAADGVPSNWTPVGGLGA